MHDLNGNERQYLAGYDANNVDLGPDSTLGAKT